MGILDPPARSTIRSPDLTKTRGARVTNRGSIVYYDPTLTAFASLILADGASSLWKLDETSGTAAVDAAGANNATWSGATNLYALGLPGPVAGVPAPGLWGGFLTAPDHASNQFAWEFTMEALVRTTLTGATQIMIGKGASANEWLGIATGGQPAVSIGGQQANSVATGKNDGGWHHVVSVVRGPTEFLYVDAVLVAVKSVALPLVTSGSMQLGNFISVFPLTGQLSHCAIYPKALTLGQIEAHFEALPSTIGAVATVASPTISGSVARIIYPPGFSATTPTPLVYFHVGNAQAASAITTDAAMRQTVQALTYAGYVVACIVQSTTHWGSQAQLDAQAALHTYMGTQMNVSKVGLVGQSMGGLPALLDAASGLYGAALKAFYGIFPVANLANMFGANAGTYAAEIRGAYGIAADGSDYASKTSGHDPVLKAASAYAGLYMRAIASAADTTVSKTNNTDALMTLVTGQAAEASTVTHTGNHGDASAYVPGDVLALLKRAGF